MISRISIGAFANIYDVDGRVLLVRQNYARKKWTTPGGGVEANETPIEALRREVNEEVGLELQDVRLAGIYWKAYANDLVFSFNCVAVSLVPVSRGLEIMDLTFCNPSELPSPMAGNTAIRILDAVFSHQSGPILRILKSEPRIGRMTVRSTNRRMFHSH